MTVTLTKIAKNQAPKRGVGSSNLLVEARIYNVLRNNGGISVFKIAKQAEIGKYLSKLVNSKFDSHELFVELG